jgi:hypothetical protein
LLFPLEHFWQHSGKRQFETIGLKELAVAKDVGRGDEKGQSLLIQLY